MSGHISECSWWSWEWIWLLIWFFATIFQDTHIDRLNWILNHLSLCYSVSGPALRFLRASSFQIDFINIYSCGLVGVNTLLHYVDDQWVLILSWPLYVFEQWVSFKVTTHLLILRLISEHIGWFESLPLILVRCLHVVATRSCLRTCLTSTLWRLSCCNFGALRFDNLLTRCVLLHLPLNICTLSGFLGSLVVNWNFICDWVFFIFVETWFFLQTSNDLLLWMPSFFF